MTYRLRVMLVATLVLVVPVKPYGGQWNHGHGSPYKACTTATVHHYVTKTVNVGGSGHVGHYAAGHYVTATDTKTIIATTTTTQVFSTTITTASPTTTTTTTTSTTTSTLTLFTTTTSTSTTTVSTTQTVISQATATATLVSTVLNQGFQTVTLPCHIDPRYTVHHGPHVKTANSEKKKAPASAEKDAAWAWTP
ncbi:integumentary mucin C.1 [Hyalella azteca]|uniref:Integumentary mucin C.1 n=1 Tax=Hyalella azteca TaxID=294128 RepID=A0A8B7NX15_HYAAZ|nr:integumentary mucin C.1 [Hyalella azteca]